MSLRLKHRRPAAAGIKQEQEDDSDTEEPHLGLRRPEGLESQIIHSGHFMVSSPHTEHPPKKGYDFDTVNKQTCRTYHFGKASMCHLSIDASLTKLFECMTLAYSGKLVSPKWKNFKGLKLLWRDKIRLNNAIWRAWYMQYVAKRDNPVCHFVTPLDGTMGSDIHRPAEAAATEGKCRKRRIEIVIREYHKWRTYFKKRLQKHKDEDLSSLLKDEESAARRMPRKHSDTPAPMEMDPLFDMDVLMSEFSDTLFSTLISHQSVPWPNPREIAHAGNADMIQPGLIPLQPNLDFMDSFDPLQDLFHSLRQPNLPSVSPTASSVTPLPSSSSQSQAQLMSPMQLSTNHISPAGPLPLPSPMTIQTSRPVGEAASAAFTQSYLPLFPGQMAPGSQSQLSHKALAQCLSSQSMDGGEAAAPSVITHTASSTVRPGDAATTFSHGSDYGGSMSSQPQLQPLASTSARPPQTFAVPRPVEPAAPGKNGSMQRIAPAGALGPSQLILAGPFSSHPITLIVTPSPVKTEMVPNSGLIITPSPLAAAPGFHVMSQPQKSPQPIVPKEKPCSSSHKNQKSPSSLVHSQPGSGQGSGQGSPCSLDKVPSPQTLTSSSTALVKNEKNQSLSQRATHMSSADQKRRTHIKSGFKTLCSLVPTLKTQSNITNAVTLQKTVEHIGKLQQERQQMQEEVRRLREEIDELNASINLYQEQLPATGVPTRRHHFDHMQEFNDYVKNRTLQNWKFWIFSIIIKPLFESFNGMVSTSSRAELYHTTLQWLERHCSLRMLRPMVLSTLRQLSTSTSILSDPSLLPEEAVRAVSHSDA